MRARAGDLTLHVTGDVSLTNAVAASGNLVTLTSDTGGITQANNPDAVIYGSRLNARAGGDILLGGANQFGVLSLDLTGSATVNVVGKPHAGRHRRRGRRPVAPRAGGSPATA